MNDHFTRNHSVADALRSALSSEVEALDGMPLNGQAVLDAAAAAVNGSQSMRESVAGILRAHWHTKEIDDPVTHRGDYAG